MTKAPVKFWTPGVGLTDAPVASQPRKDGDATVTDDDVRDRVLASLARPWVAANGHKRSQVAHSLGDIRNRAVDRALRSLKHDGLVRFVPSDEHGNPTWFITDAGREAASALAAD